MNWEMSLFHGNNQVPLAYFFRDGDIQFLNNLMKNI